MIGVVNTYFMTSFQNVSIHVQPVRYQSQPGYDPHHMDLTVLSIFQKAVTFDNNLTNKI